MLNSGTAHEDSAGNSLFCCFMVFRSFSDSVAEGQEFLIAIKFNDTTTFGLPLFCNLIY